MNSNEFQKLCQATNPTEEEYTRVWARLSEPGTLQILHGLMGAVTEVGEAMDVLKKHLIYGAPLDIVNLREEGGDGLWYWAIIFSAIDTTFANEMARNVAKLKSRYGEKFTAHAALNRDLDKERQILEK